MRLCLLIILAVLLLPFKLSSQSSEKGEAATQTKGALMHEIPAQVDTGAVYLFYLHGQIIEVMGVRPRHPEWGVYEYKQIVDAFRNEGFIVVSEPRAKDTDVHVYARKVAEQVRQLLKNGVPAKHITVVGASKGAVITMLTSTFLQEKAVNFVTIAACNTWVFENIDVRLAGRVLSIYEQSDTHNASCKAEYFKRSSGISQFKEIKVNTGLGHGVLYRPIREWFEPTVKWARLQN